MIIRKEDESVSAVFLWNRVLLQPMGSFLRPEIDSMRPCWYTCSGLYGSLACFRLHRALKYLVTLKGAVETTGSHHTRHIGRQSIPDVSTTTMRDLTFSLVTPVSERRMLCYRSLSSKLIYLDVGLANHGNKEPKASPPLSTPSRTGAG